MHTEKLDTLALLAVISTLSDQLENVESHRQKLESDLEECRATLDALQHERDWHKSELRSLREENRRLQGEGEFAQFARRDAQLYASLLPLKREVIDLLAATPIGEITGNRIAMIKRVRDTGSYDLRESKVVVERWIADAAKHNATAENEDSLPI